MFFSFIQHTGLNLNVLQRAPRSEYYNHICNHFHHFSITLLFKMTTKVPKRAV